VLAYQATWAKVLEEIEIETFETKVQGLTKTKVRNNLEASQRVSNWGFKGSCYPIPHLQVGLINQFLLGGSPHLVSSRVVSNPHLRGRTPVRRRKLTMVANYFLTGMLLQEGYPEMSPPIFCFPSKWGVSSWCTVLELFYHVLSKTHRFEIYGHTVY